MNLPPWLANLTGANAFANNPANGFQPTFGDAMQGIGHSLMEHYRRGQPQEAAANPAGFNPMLGMLGGMVPPMGILGQQLLGGGAPAAPAPLAQEPVPHKVKGAPPIDFGNQEAAVNGIMQGSAPAAPPVPLNMLAHLFKQ